MSDFVWGALITAGGAIVVALISLYQHRTEKRDKAEAIETDKRLAHGEALFVEYRLLLDETQKDRDYWRRRAQAAEIKEH